MSHRDVACDVRNFGFRYSWSEDFNRFAFQSRTTLLFKLYRIFTFLYFLAWLIYFGGWHNQPGADPYFFIFLTNWSFILCNVFLLSALLVCFATPNKKLEITSASNPWELKLPWYFVVHWILHYMSALASVLVAILYWTLLASSGDNVTDARNIHVHGISGLFHLINFIITAVPFRLFHFYLPMIYTTTYVVFTGIYYAAGGTDRQGDTYIYSVIDYKKEPGKAAAYVVSLGTIGVLLAHGIFYLIYKLRLRCSGPKQLVYPINISRVEKVLY